MPVSRISRFYFFLFFRFRFRFLCVLWLNCGSPFSLCGSWFKYFFIFLWMKEKRKEKREKVDLSSHWKFVIFESQSQLFFLFFFVTIKLKKTCSILNRLIRYLRKTAPKFAATIPQTHLSTWSSFYFSCPYVLFINGQTIIIIIR